MRIIGFNLTKILIEKEEGTRNNLKVNQNINIKSIEKDKIPISNDEVLKIKFNLSIDYSENYAKLMFEGSVVILPEKQELKQFLDSWKNKKIPEGVRIPLFNFIMNKCNIRALYLEDEFGLPYHIPMPRISTENQQPFNKNSNNKKFN